MRNVVVYSTKGQRMVKIQSEAATWGELKTDLDKEGIDYKDMQVVCNENKAILKLDGAVLPVGTTQGAEVLKDVTIFLSPQKQRAGSNCESMNYQELRTIIKELRSSNDEAKDHFGNYTNSTTEDLRDLLQEWYDENGNNEENHVLVVENSKIGEVMDLLQKAISVLGIIPQVKETSEFENLKEQAEAIEFELFQKG